VRRFADTYGMVELRELRANRIGITFRNPLKRDPFRFDSSSLLLWILYGITRPAPSASRQKLQRTLALAPVPASTPRAGQPWGNDDPKTMVWPRRRYE
jgi:hypothetical protein